jgi:hypothetical protein
VITHEPVVGDGGAARAVPAISEASLTVEMVFSLRSLAVLLDGILIPEDRMV